MIDVVYSYRNPFPKVVSRSASSDIESFADGMTPGQ
jgi:hypothetical protein